jgi:hypothetical protein
MNQRSLRGVGVRASILAGNARAGQPREGRAQETCNDSVRGSTDGDASRFD